MSIESHQLDEIQVLFLRFNRRVERRGVLLVPVELLLCVSKLWRLAARSFLLMRATSHVFRSSDVHAVASITVDAISSSTILSLGRRVAKETSRWVMLGCVLASPLRRLRVPSTPGSSIAAYSWIPAPFRTTRRDPSLFTPEPLVTTCPRMPFAPSKCSRAHHQQQRHECQLCECQNLALRFARS